jgi:hypothetical protein
LKIERFLPISLTFLGRRFYPPMSEVLLETAVSVKETAIQKKRELIFSKF